MLLMTGFALGCLCLVMVLIARDFGNETLPRVFLLMLITASAYLIDPLVDPQWHWITSDLQTANPALFWLLCQLTFARRPRVWTPWGAVALFTFLAPAITRPFGTPQELTPTAAFFGWELGRYLEYAIILHALWTVVSHWQDDLVAARRRARLVLLLVVGSAISLAVVSLNEGLYDQYTRGLITSVGAFTVALFLLRGRDGLLSTDTPQPTAPEPPETHLPTPQEQALQDLMADGYYRTEKLTLGRLANAIALPEYRTRELINRRLGYRNFNDYINHLRIEEATGRLRSEPDTPVLNIALDVGYRSLSSFNRAFREITGMSPTEYRR